MEVLLTPAELSALTGGVFSARDIRAACRRGPKLNRLPHVEKGETRPRYFIAAADFSRWLEREKEGD